MPIILDGTKGETFPTWTTGTRPATPNAGQTGYNTTLATLERYNGTTWGPIVTTADSGTVTQTMLGTNVAGNGPAFSAYVSSSQSAPSTGVWTKVQLNSVSSPGFNINNNFDATTNYRFTPTVAGYYQINGAVSFTSGATSLTICALYKNGSLYKSGINLSAGTVYHITVSDIVYFNGSTDYMELYVYLSSTTALLGTSPYTSMSGALVRAG